MTKQSYNNQEIKQMFANSYQNGSYFQIWDSKMNQDKNQHHKNLYRIHPSSNNKFFDKQVKSYLYSLHGQSARIILPATDQKELALHQKYLVLHICIPTGSSWSMELGITDVNAIKRRINLTTVQGKQQIKYFSLRYPLDYLQKGSWVFLVFNVYSFMQAFKDQVFRSLDHITVGSNCKIRRIFTMKEWDQTEIPKNFYFLPQILQQFQLIEYQSQSLPKISMGKHIVMNISQPGQSLYEKLTPNKRDSKIALAKSEINPNQSMARSKIYHQNQGRSPSKPVSLEPITKKQSSNFNKNNKFSSKLRLNSMRDELFDNHVEQLIQSNYLSGIKNNSSFENQNINIVNQLHQKRQKGLVNSSQASKMKSGKNIRKVTATKSPKIQKSFQEDEALNFRPENSDIGIEQTSNENSQILNEHTKDQSKKKLKKSHNSSHFDLSQNEKPDISGNKKEQQIQRWSEDDQNTKVQIKRQTVHKKGENQVNNLRQSENRTIIKKENKQITIEQDHMKDNEIELIYDEMVECYYHPETHTYYEIKQE